MSIVPSWHGLYPVYILLSSNYFESLTRLECFSLSSPLRLQQRCDGGRRCAMTCVPVLPRGFLPAGAYDAPQHPRDSRLNRAQGVQLSTGSYHWVHHCHLANPTGYFLCTGNMQLPYNFSDLSEEFLRNWEVRGISQLTPVRRDRHWKFVRASRSDFDRIPAALDMDVIFYRFPSEHGYCQRLSQLKPRTGRNGQV
jgi:hypothetical protein